MNIRQKYEPLLRSGSLFAAACFLPLQTISRRSAQLVTGIPTRALMCRSLSDSWRMMICRAQECHWRSRVPLTLSLHPLSPHCHCLAGHITPATHRRHKCPNTPSTLRHLKHPGNLWLHSSHSSLWHLNSQKVRLICLCLLWIVKNSCCWMLYTYYALRPWSYPNMDHTSTTTHGINNAGQLSDTQ